MRETLKQAAARADAASAEACCLSIALREILAKRGATFRRGEYTLRIVKPAGPEGGIVVVDFHPQGQTNTVSAHYWEHWFDSVRDHANAGGAEARTLYDLASQAWNYIHDKQRKAGLGQ